MRSIGAWKIKKLKKIVNEEMKKKANMWQCDYQAVRQIRADIMARIPEDWYETWECAWSEIERLVDDFINDWDYQRQEA